MLLLPLLRIRQAPPRLLVFTMRFLLAPPRRRSADAATVAKIASIAKIAARIVALGTKTSRKNRMEADKIAPFTPSPLDSARGRGKHRPARVKHTQSRRKDKETREPTINIVFIKSPNTLSSNSVGANVK